MSNLTIKCYCLEGKAGNLHCPLSTSKRDLELTFNYQVRGESIREVEIDADFVCNDARRSYCKNCPFK